ncbi:hypothetical protein C9426_31935 [Serratia sp. S1B]|nr:hypothetical protein C9426_31935 [Serratia sp. S1B]
MANGRYELKKSSNGQYHFVLKTSNGEIILSSERYASKASAENGIVSVQTNSPLKTQFEIKISNDNKPYFVLKAKNQQVIGTSPLYSSQRAAQDALESAVMHGPSSEVYDLSI